MDNRIAIKQGFTLLEMTLVLIIVGVFLGVIITNGTNYMNRAKYQATVREMNSIAQAAIDNYNSSNNPNDTTNPRPLVWPNAISTLSNNIDLSDNNMPQVVAFNPFGPNYPYLLSHMNNAVKVTTTIPKGILRDPTEGTFLNYTPGVLVDQLSITLSVPNEFSGRLSYDLQYIDR